MKPELCELLNYIESEGEFTYILRMEYEWKQDQFEKLIDIVKRTMLAYKNEDVIPKALVYLLTKDIELIIGITTNELFFKGSIPEEHTRAQYKEIVNEGIKELSRLKDKLLVGDYNEL